MSISDFSVQKMDSSIQLTLEISRNLISSQLQGGSSEILSWFAQKSQFSRFIYQPARLILLIDLIAHLIFTATLNEWMNQQYEMRLRDQFIQALDTTSKSTFTNQTNSNCRHQKRTTMQLQGCGKKNFSAMDEQHRDSNPGSSDKPLTYSCN